MILFILTLVNYTKLMSITKSLDNQRKINDVISAKYLKDLMLFSNFKEED